MHTAGGYDYILWQKAPLTNLVMIADAIGLVVHVIVTAQAAVKSGCAEGDFLT